MTLKHFSHNQGTRLQLRIKNIEEQLAGIAFIVPMRSKTGASLNTVLAQLQHACMDCKEETAEIITPATPDSSLED